MRILAVVLFFAASCSIGAWADGFKRSDEVKSHLEGMGYTVETKGDSLEARHTKMTNIKLTAHNGGIYIGGFFPATEAAKSDRTGFLAFVNALNKDSTSTRYYTDKDNDVVFEAWYPGDYDQGRFGIFIEKFNELGKQLQGSTDAQKYLQ